MRQTSCYCFPWRGLHRRGNAGIVWVGQPGDYATFNSHQSRYATAREATMHTNIRIWKQKCGVTNFLYTSILAVSALGFGTGAIGAHDKHKGDSDQADSIRTASPIKHVIILIGENRGFDHTFGVYIPKGKKQTISNILSKGIVNL